MHDHDRHAAREWDDFYAGDGDGTPQWSGRHNGTLADEVADLAPGTALDVGCGEGADAIWLARRGWRVTGLDPSRVALDRAEAAAREADVEITWVAAGLPGMPGGTGVHDLVSAHYAVLPRSEDDAAIDALLGAVAAGGTLLVVHHDLDAAHAAERDIDRSDHLMPSDVAARLEGDPGWSIEVHERRARQGEHLSADARAVPDVIVRARRRPAAERT